MRGPRDQEGTTTDQKWDILDHYVKLGPIIVMAHNSYGP